MTDSEKNIYAVVLFLPRKLSNNLLNLVPSFWISTMETDILCQFPAKEDYPKLPEWVETLKTPEDDWGYYKVEIISYARNLKQGRRRLNRLNRVFTAMKGQSTDCDNESNNKNSASKVSQDDNLQEEINDTSQIILNHSLKTEFIKVEMIAPDLEEKSPRAKKRKTTRGTEEQLNLDDDDLSARNKFGFLKKHIDEKFDEMLAAINSAKTSILYEIKKKINDLKDTIIANGATELPSNNIANAKGDLGTILPIKTIEEFLCFEEEVANSQEKRNALMSLYRIITCGEMCVKNCVKKLMTATICKSVQLEYSAFGRHVRGVGKRDFSKTQTFLCISSLIMDKCSESDEFKKLPTIISRWLSGAGDREGGRKQRLRTAELEFLTHTEYTEN